MKPPLNHMMLHEDTLADEFDAILGYRTSHAGVVLPGGQTFTYYFSDSTGDDTTGDGSINAPWKTLSKASTISNTMTAGQSIGFMRGDTWTAETLTVGASGSAGNRIVFGAYGTGDKPVFDGNFAVTSMIDAFNRTYLRFENLHLKNQQDASGRRCMRLGSSTTGTVHDIELYEVETTDSYGGGDDGIYCERNVTLLLDNCTLRGSENHVAFHAGATYTIAVTAVDCRFETCSVASFGWNSTGTTSLTATRCTWHDCAKLSQLQSVTLDRCTVTCDATNNRPSAIDAMTAIVRYSLIDYTACTVTNTQFLSSGTAGQTYTFQNCTFLGNNAGTARGAMYAGNAANSITWTNCAFVRWWRAGFSTSTSETANYCYFDGLVSDGINTNTAAVTTAGYCDLATGRPNSNLTTANKGTDLGLGALVDYAGDTVTVAAPTRGCYENTA